MFDPCYCINSMIYLLKFGKLHGTILCHGLAASERVHIFSSPEPKAHGKLLPSANVRRPSSVVRRPSSTIASNNISSETAKPRALIFGM